VNTKATATANAATIIRFIILFLLVYVMRNVKLTTDCQVQRKTCRSCRFSL